MSHVIIAFYGHKSAHEKLVTEINNWRYECEGPKRTGMSAPYISEIKFYDIRLPKANVPEFLRDLRPHLNTHPKYASKYKSGQAKDKLINVAHFGIRMLRKLVGLKECEPASGEQVYKLNTSWYYSYLIGVVDNDQNFEPVSKEIREVI